MQTATIEVKPGEAERMLRKYREHKAWASPVDLEIEQVYAQIEKGRKIVRALASITQAGLGEDKLPKLAIARADAERCWLACQQWNNTCLMHTTERMNHNTQASRFEQFPAESFPGIARGRHVSIVPHIPPDIRPRRGLQNYAILYEAVWKEEPPVDPILMRRLGAADFWIVLGAWELTEVERAVLAGRLGRH